MPLRDWIPATLRAAPAVLLLASVALLAVACGSDAEARTLSEPTARLVAGDALIRESELPEARWRLVPAGQAETGSQDLAPDDLFDSPACEALNRFFNEGERAPGEPAPIALAERSFEAADGTFTLHAVRSAVAVYATEEEAADAASLAAKALTVDALRDCLGEGLVGFEQDGVEITRVDLSGPAASVAGSAGITLDIEIFAVFFTMDLQLHVYTFQRQHTVASLVTLELNPGLLQNEQQPLLDAFAGRVARAHEGK